MSSLDDLSRSIIPQLFLIVILTLINAFFASAEMAFVSVNRHKIDLLSKQDNKKAKLLNKLLNDPSNFLATIQVAITLAGFLSSASAATSLSVVFCETISPYNIPYVENISLILTTIILSFFTLVFGELVPKRIALNKCEEISLFAVKPIYFISIISKPFIKILSFATKIILKLTGNNQTEIQDKLTTEDIKLYVTKFEEDGNINCMEKEMINKVFDFPNKTSVEIMTSRTDTLIIDINDKIENILTILLNCKYSRIPVYEDNIDNIIGVLYVKDLIRLSLNSKINNANLKSILHLPYFIPETKKINELFISLKQNKNHIAILIDEYGGFSGIVTLEDIIEEIVGDIYDEYDKNNNKIKFIDDNIYEVKGNMSILDFNDFFNTNIKCDDCDTINGYIISIINKIPTSNENITLNIGVYELKVLQVEDNRIEKIRINLLNENVS